MRYHDYHIEPSYSHWISKEDENRVAKKMYENSPMHDINKHYDEELRLLNAMMAEMQKQADDSDKKHKQVMRWTRWAFTIAFLTFIATLCSLCIMYING